MTTLRDPRPTPLPWPRSTRPAPRCVDDVGAADVGDHLGHVVEGERVVTHLFACTRPGYPGWRWSVTVARATASEGRHRRRGRADPGRRGDRRARVGALPRAASSPATSRPATCCPSRRTTRGWCRRTPSATTRSTPTTRRRSARSPRTSASAGSAPSRSEGRDLAAQRWYDGDGGPSRRSPSPRPTCCINCGFLVRHRRPAGRHVRRLRQRQRQRRRPGGLASTTAAAPTPRSSWPRSTSRRRCPTTSSTPSTATSSRRF